MQNTTVFFSSCRNKWVLYQTKWTIVPTELRRKFVPFKLRIELILLLLLKSYITHHKYIMKVSKYFIILRSVLVCQKYGTLQYYASLNYTRHIGPICHLKSLIIQI